LAKCWNNFFFFKILYMIILWKWQVYDYTVKMSSQNIFFSPVQPNFFSSRFRIKIIFRENNIKLKLNSLRGKLIKKNCKTKMVLSYTNKKTNKTVVIIKSHEKIFPSKIRLFFISLNSYFILILWFFFLNIILISSLEEKNWAGQEKKIYSDLTFSQYNHILAIFTV
jgi:hypothetical protein